MKKTSVKATAWLVTGALAGALTTVSLQSVARGPVMSALPMTEVQHLTEVFELLKRRYVEPVDEKKLLTDAIRGMLTALDPHSVYLDAKTLKGFKESISGTFVGVGIEIDREGDLIKVVAPIEGSPADRAGLKSGDLITKIDNTPVRTLSQTEAVKRIRGEPRTKVVLTILRKSEGGRTFPVTIVREEIKSKSVKSEMRENDYGWIRVNHFQDRTVEEFVKQLENLYAANPKMKGLVLDLRNNPGGYLDSAVAIVAAFVPAGKVVVSTKGQIPDANSVIKTDDKSYGEALGDALAKLDKNTRGFYKTVPMVVLINEGSASASEIVAGALQDHKRATLLGNQSFGKGSVQQAFCLDGPGYVPIHNCKESAVKFTVSRYYTPSGRSIQAKGILPELLVDEAKEGDPYAALRMREADDSRHIASGQGGDITEDQREKERNAALRRLGEEYLKPPEQRYKPPEIGSERDFQLLQALNKLKGQPVQVSKTLSERKTENKEESEE